MLPRKQCTGMPLGAAMASALRSTDCSFAGSCYAGPEEPLVLRVREQKRDLAIGQSIANPVVLNSRSEFAGPIVAKADGLLMFDVFTPSYKVYVAQTVDNKTFIALTAATSNGQLVVDNPSLSVKSGKMVLYFTPISQAVLGDTVRVMSITLI